jgi:hypothetical protein
MPIITIKKDTPPTKVNTDKLHAELTSLIPGHINSKQPWTFYEEIDAFLGPWGESGYPLAYGKYYCKLFNQDPNLRANFDARLWVERTTVKLQEALRDGIVYAFAHEKLPQMTEAEFRAFAFGTHPEAYQRGGLSSVIANAPYLVPVISTIPGKEFVPFYSDNFWATIRQALDTMVRMGGDIGAAGAGPAHTGILVKANQESGMNQLLAIQRRNREYEALFANVQSALRSGRLDRILWLEQVGAKLQETQFEDPYWLGIARSTMADVEKREHGIAARYRAMSTGHPEMLTQIQQFDPNWSKY